MIDDTALVTFLREHPGQSLRQICERFEVMEDGIRTIRNQLQRLRQSSSAPQLRCVGTKWEVR